MSVLRATPLTLFVLAAAALPALAADQTVIATDSDEFVPRNVTVDPGDTVTWRNQGDDHNVKFDDGSFEQPPAPSSSAWTVSRTFTTPGTFRYYCEAHGGPGGAGMSGTVVVRSPEAPPRPPLHVSLQISDSTPRRGQPILFHGSVAPQRDGQIVRIQRRTARGGFATIGRSRLRDAGATRSTYAMKLRLYRDGAFRAVVHGDRDHATGISRLRHVDVH
jgi:plastocyanin